MNGYIALIRCPFDGAEWEATFPDLPECRAVGSSIEDAVAKAREMLSAHLAAIAVSGGVPPRARQPGEMLLAANEDSELAARMVGAVLKAIELEPAATLRLTAAGAARQYGFYGEERVRRRA